MSSIRSRIDAFEALSKKSEDSSKDKKNESRKRFRNPGTSSRRGAPEQEVDSLRDFISMNKTASKTQDLSDFEADLQEVWSVRKNIHHNGGATTSTSTGSGTSSSLPSVQVKAGQYSRHGAIPAQQTQGPAAQSKGFPFETKRAPLQENNSKDTPWNVKTSGYSYNSQDATRKQEHHAPEEKVSYAKKMAQGYLKSVGMGEYTPKASGYSKQGDHETQVKQTWKKAEDDFDFNEPKSNNPSVRKISSEAAPRPTDSGKPIHFSHAKENQTLVHKPDGEGQGEAPSKSKVDEAATVKWQRADEHNFDFGEIKASSPSTDKKSSSEIATPASEENRAQEHRHPNDKLNYAKRMAQGYLKSEGLGVYTPQPSGYAKQSKTEESHSQQKRIERRENDSRSKSPARKISSENDRPTVNQEKKAVCVRVTPESEQRKTDEKLNYAKRMAQSYLRKEGLGEFSPQSSNYVKQADESHSHPTWMKVETGSSETKTSSENRLSTGQTEEDHNPPPERLSYAKRMAKGYLRSVGMGEYTPKASGYSKQSKSSDNHSQKQPPSSSTQWKNLKGSDEQDFDL